MQPKINKYLGREKKKEWGKTQDATEAAILKENLNQTFWICMCWVLPTQTPTSVTSRRVAS